MSWITTFSDISLLLLTFFVLLLSFAKMEAAKYETAVGSIRDAFGGTPFKKEQTMELGRALDDRFTVLEGPEVVRPFPIEFLSSQGILKRYEINRASVEEVRSMEGDLVRLGLRDHVLIEELAEGVRVKLQDAVYFRPNSKDKDQDSTPPLLLERLAEFLRATGWSVFVQGHARPQEKSDKLGPYELSMHRALGVARELIGQGVSPKKVTTVFYGDSRSPNKGQVELMLRKVDLDTPGYKVD